MSTALRRCLRARVQREQGHVFACVCLCAKVSSHHSYPLLLPPIQESLTQTWDEERGRVGKVQAIKEKLDALKSEIETAERGYDLNKAAELKYAVMPDLQVRL